MKKKVGKILDFGIKVLPFVLFGMGVVGFLAEKDSGYLRIGCIWGVIGCMEARIERLEKKNGNVH